MKTDRRVATTHAITRREAVWRLLLGAGGVSLLHGSPLIAQAFPDRFPDWFQPTSPCDLRSLRHGALWDIGILAIAGGGWGFQSQTATIEQSFVAVAGAVEAAVIEIDLSFVESDCSGTCIYPSIPIGGYFNGITSSNPNNSASITESFQLQVIVDNARCSNHEPSSSEASDYALLLSSGHTTSGHFAMFWPSTQSIVTSRFGRLRQFAVPYSLQPQCFLANDAGTAITNVLWPNLQGFFYDGEFVTVTPFNVVANCPSGDCTGNASPAVPAVLSLCFGPSALTTYYWSPY